MTHFAMSGFDTSASRGRSMVDWADQCGAQRGGSRAARRKAYFHRSQRLGGAVLFGRKEACHRPVFVRRSARRHRDGRRDRLDQWTPCKARCVNLAGARQYRPAVVALVRRGTGPVLSAFPRERRNCGEGHSADRFRWCRAGDGAGHAPPIQRFARFHDCQRVFAFLPGVPLCAASMVPVM
jgi:hypothetical protein